MQQIFNFLIKSRNFLWFLFLLIIAVSLTIQSHTYHSNKFIHSSSLVTGAVFNVQNDISTYFRLKAYNKRLLIENTLLKQQLNEFTSNTSPNKTYDIDSLDKFEYISANVINSTYRKKKNYLTLNKGSKDSVVADMGVITDLGIVGIVKNVSRKYATVISILNKNSKINAQLKKTNHFGTLVWDGNEPNVVQLIDIPRLAPLKYGDTIITGGRSTIFPKGINIGTVRDFNLNDDQNYFTVNVDLFNDMTDVGFVQLIQNTEVNEIKQLENSSNE